MVFWGLEVKPGQTFPFDTECVPGRLHITQATLGTGSSTKRCVLQCVVGDNTPIFLCSLLPDMFENCPLNLEFEEDGVVSFSTIGSRSIFLSGFIETDGQDMDGDDFEADSFGEDISETDSEAFSDDDTEFSDEDVLMYPPPSPIPNNGVVIEEIVDEENPASETVHSKHSKKRGQMTENGDSDASQKQIVAKDNSSVHVSESEDEDGFPVPAPTQSRFQNQDSKAVETADGKSKNAKKKRSRDETTTKTDKNSIDQPKREEKKASDSSLQAAGATDNNEQPKKKKKNASRELKKAEGAGTTAENKNEETPAADKKKSETEINPVTDGDQSSEKKGKTKKKKDKTEKAAESANLVEKETEAKASQLREFPNGLVIEELKMGRPNGKRASPGKRVSVIYIGKLKKNGSIFDSNVGRAPFKFRLGVGQVIKGWDVGVNGMRVGDKRRLTIPPMMGYGAQGAGPKIPPNSWLMFDVELVDVN